MSGELDIFTAPADWSDGETPSETKLNQQIRDNPNVLGLVLAGDKSAVRAHRHRRGIFADRPAAGNLGRYYFATDQGGRYFDDGSDWQLVGHHPDLADRIHDDFQVAGGAPDQTLITNTVAPGPVGHGWFCEDQGAGNGNVGRLSIGPHGSVMVINSSGSVGNGWRVSPRGFDQPIMHADQMAPLVMDCFLFAVSISDNDYFVGVSSVLPFARPMAPTIGCGFRFASGGAATFEAYTATTGKTTQITDTLIVPALDDGNFDRLRMELESSDGAGVGVIRYFINDVLKATHTIAPHGSSIVPGFSFRNNTTSTRTIAADLFDLVWPRHYF